MHRFLIFSFLMMLSVMQDHGFEGGPSVEFGGIKAFDEAGNIYIVVHRGIVDVNEHSGFLKKYDKEGKMVWARRYCSAADGFGSCTALAVDPHGNAYVTGIMGKIKDGEGVDGSIVTTTVKYDKNGKRSWEVRYDVAKIDSFSVEDMAVDTKGNICIIGQYTKDDPFLLDFDAESQIDVNDEYSTLRSGQFATIKYGTNGQKLWDVRYGEPNKQDNYPHDITIDKEGSIYVTGGSFIYEGDDDIENFLTIKYASDGRLLWLARYVVEPASNGCASCLRFDDAGNIYVLGKTWSDERWDLVLIKYDQNGKEQWVVRYMIPRGKWISWMALKLNRACDVCVSVCVSPRWHGTDHPSIDWINSMSKKREIFTLKYDANGKERWSAKYKGPEGSFIYSEDLLVDHKNNVYIIGYINANAMVIKYDSHGDEKWVRQFKTAPELMRFLTTMRKIP